MSCMLGVKVIGDVTYCGRMAGAVSGIAMGEMRVISRAG